VDKGLLLGAGPVRRFLRPGRLGIGEVRGAEHTDEYLRLWVSPIAIRLPEQSTNGFPRPHGAGVNFGRRSGVNFARRLTPKRQKPQGYAEPNYPYKYVPELGWP